MASIYQNSFLTICANLSPSDDGGYYSDLPPNYIIKTKTIRMAGGTEYDLHFRVHPDIVTKEHLPSWQRTLMNALKEDYPLLTRAGTY
jgi:predicted phosphoadenosine phosphosulfate sulfurtransferase